MQVSLWIRRSAAVPIGVALACASLCIHSFRFCYAQTPAKGSAPGTKSAAKPAAKGASPAPPPETRAGAVAPSAEVPAQRTVVPAKSETPLPDPKSAPDPTAANLEDLIKATINDSATTVTVRCVMNRYVAVLSGKMASKDDLDKALARVQDLIENAKLDSLILVNAMESGSATHRESDVSHMWQCAFIQGDADYDAKVKLQNVADALNIMLPCGNGRQPYVTVKDTNLWLQGPLSRVQAIRAMLAMIDAPLPQVKLEVWAIQYAGSQQNVGKRMLELSQEISQAHHGADLARRALAYAISKNAASIDADPSFQMIRSVGFDMDPHAAESLIECLWCLGVCKDRALILKDAGEALKAQLAAEPSWLTAGLQHGAPMFPNLSRLLAPVNAAAAYDTLPADQLTLQQFAGSLKAYIAFVDALGLYGPVLGDKPDQLLLDYPAAPEALARQSLAVDRHLEALVTAYSADMEQMFFMPLLQQAQQWSYGGGQGGVGLAGKTTIAVTSRFKADVTPQLQAYGERQIPRTLGDRIFNLSTPVSPSGSGGAASVTGAAPAGASAGGTATASGGAAGAAQGGAQTLISSAQNLVAGMTMTEKAGLLAALQPPADVSYYSVAPGIAIHVTPIMTPDGTSAELKLDATFGIDTHVQKDDSSGAQGFRPPDAVKEDHVVTEANVGGFNLFEVSSFNMDTVYPRPPFITPVLGNLPIVGSMFRFGRGTSRTFHQSIILVNATLIPRSLGLVGFYGANFAGRRVLTATLPPPTAGRGQGSESVGKYDHTKKLHYDDFLKGK